MRTVCVTIEPGPDGVSPTRDDPGPLPRSDAYVIRVRAVPDGLDDHAVLRRVAEAHDPEHRTRSFTYHYDDLSRERGDKGTNMPVGQPLFLGFKSVRDLVARHPLRDQVFYFPVVESEVDGQGMGKSTHRLIVSAFLEDGVIGYVSFDLAREAIMGGQRWGPDGAPSDPSSRIDSAVKLTRAHLRELGMEPIEAVLARPRNYTYLSVTPDFLDYDKATDSFVPRKPQTGPDEV